MNNLINLSSDNNAARVRVMNVDDCEISILLCVCCFSWIFIYSLEKSLIPYATTDGRKMISPSHLSSYESLDHFNGTTETLKINDDYIQKRNNILNTNVCDILSSIATTQYHHDRWGWCNGLIEN